MNKLTIEKIKALGSFPDDMNDHFLRIANGLINHAGYSEEKTLGLLAQALERPKLQSTRKSKIKKLAKRLYDLQKEGKSVLLSEEGQKYLPKKIPLTDLPPPGESQEVELRERPLPYSIFGEEFIENGALEQMNNAVSLPIAVAGSLMPDAHQGYGLPIGGVLATQADKIIPYAVGVDIACRMCLSVFDLPTTMFTKEHDLLRKSLVESSNFGIGGTVREKFDESVMDKTEWGATKVVRDLKDKAYSQLGTSGTGNHFVEWGMLDVTESDDLLDLPKGSYLALLSHSGSRGFGGTIANYYSKIARQKTVLPKEAAHLAWLDLNTEEGQEYWIAMNLAGEYASANHHEIHGKVAKALNQKPLKMVENHHNFAWKEMLNGNEVIVHRKGATPAGINDLGIIPGSMTAPGFVVRGLANESSINSASHGAGRQMSRTQAFKTVTRNQVDDLLTKHGVELIGSDLDEAPMAYKNIEDVISAQTDLIKVLAKFTPKIVRMADAKRREPRED